MHFIDIVKSRGGLLTGQQMSRASLLIPCLGVGHCHLFLAFFDQHFLLTSDVYLTNYRDPSGKVRLAWGIILNRPK